MNIYYRRYTTWCKWPWQDVKDIDEVQFSKSKKNFSENIFLTVEPSIEVPERKKKIAAALGISVKNITLQKKH